MPTTVPQFQLPTRAFMGAAATTLADLKGHHAAVFAAPHGTPYHGIDNRVYAATGQALRTALMSDAGWTDHWDFDFDDTVIAPGFRLADLGDLATTPLDGAGNRALIEAATRAVVATGAVPLMLGGDDSVPIPFFAGLAGLGPLTIIQIDAHIDWRNQRRGERQGFSSTMRRASEMSHVERIVQVGIRGFGSARQREVEIARDWGAHIVTARTVHRDGIAAALDLVPDGACCVVTLDCDALDAAVMPAVMSPTPGGLSYTQVIELIAGIAGKARLAAFDLIEFVPDRDPAGVCAITAARIVSNVIGNLAKSGSRR